MATKQVKLTVISDLSCPYCYIGQKELKAAVQEASKTTPNINFELEYRPYFLHPYIKPDEPLDKLTWFSEKFGAEQAALMMERTFARGKQCGIDFKFADDSKICSTLRAHRLLLKAWKIGGQTTQQVLLEQLFHEYFVGNQTISEVQVLASIGEKAGIMTKKEVLEYLESDEDEKAIEDMVAQARAGGVTGVPVTVIDGKWAISGGQSKDVYLQVFAKMAACCKSGGAGKCPSNGPVTNVETDDNATCALQENRNCVTTTA